MVRTAPKSTPEKTTCCDGIEHDQTENQTQTPRQIHLAYRGRAPLGCGQAQRRRLRKQAFTAAMTQMAALVDKATQDGREWMCEGSRATWRSCRSYCVA